MFLEISLNASTGLPISPLLEVWEKLYIFFSLDVFFSGKQME